MKLQSKKENIQPGTPGGFTLVEIMIVVAIIGLLSAIAVPNFVHARTTSQLNACIENLHQIDSAVQQWALENNQAPGAPVTSADITPYMARATAASVNNVCCPADSARAFASSYLLTDISTPPTCQIIPGPGPGTHSLN
jgi:prepilin-type N-terminal cleavage/methylation domain-containing protein